MPTPPPCKCHKNFKINLKIVDLNTDDPWSKSKFYCGEFNEYFMTSNTINEKHSITKHWEKVQTPYNILSNMINNISIALAQYNKAFNYKNMKGLCFTAFHNFVTMQIKKNLTSNILSYLYLTRKLLKIYWKFVMFYFLKTLISVSLFQFY